MRIAIMQPYFMPYAGYFRLMAASDLFVVYDCVQFPRRGWVHRNKLMHRSGQEDWLTLPLVKGDRDTTRIQDLQFTADAQTEWNARMGEFPVLNAIDTRSEPIAEAVRILSGNPVDYMEHTMRVTCDMLGINCDFVRSSTLHLDPGLKAQDRILAIAQHFNATHYINAPGGRELYNEAAFADRGIVLEFLSSYQGNFASMLQRLLSEPADAIAKEIYQNTQSALLPLPVGAGAL